MITFRQWAQRRDRGTLRRTAVMSALAAGLFVAGAAPAMAATQSGPAASKATVAVAGKSTSTSTLSKPRPVPPPGVKVGTVDIPKPHANITSHATIRPLSGPGWQVTVTRTVGTLWPTQFTTITATANQDVGPTPEYIYIWDQSHSTVLARCGTGTTCSVTFTQNTPGEFFYYAYISDLTDNTGGTRDVARTNPFPIDFMGVDLRLSASSYTLPAGVGSTLTETSSSDIGPTPFFVQIWDTTTGTLLQTCGSGTTCQVTVSNPIATTQSYLATFAPESPNYPPATLQSSTPTDWITWTGSGMTLSLSAPAFASNGPEMVTATASTDVGPTPYFIEIFNENGTLLQACGTGATCSFLYTPSSEPGSDLVAFIATGSGYPPSTIQASSNTVTTFEFTS